MTIQPFARPITGLLAGLFGSLFRHYKAYHAHGRPLLKYIGIIGALTYITFYLIRFTRPNPKPWDDFAPRMAVVLLFALLAARDHWPEKLRKYYLAYSYAALILCMPFFNVYFTLERHGGIPAMSNCFIALTFLVMLTDWRNTIAMLVIGIGLASTLYFGTHPHGKWPADMLAQIPAYLIILIGGGAFKLSEKQIDSEKQRLANALAGSIAHEMRNPLARVKHALEKMYVALPSPTTHGTAQAIGPAQIDALYRQLAESEVAVKRGLQVITMTLDEVGEKPIEDGGFSTLSAADVTRKALQEYAFDSDEQAARVHLQVDEDFVFRGEETAYLFVIFNLMKNALYYLAAYPRSHVTITIGGRQVTVEDNGPGIAPELKARLFQPFVSSGKGGGTGLGLAYCRRVMRAFGGEIECDSVVDQYTRFTLRFPPGAPQDVREHQRETLERARSTLAGKRVLIVDDDPALRLTARHKLQTLGLEVDQAADGQRALDALARQRYDAVLLDLHMPVVDGYAVAERVREGQAAALNRDVAIVAYTSEPAHVAAVKTRKAGMDAFMPKPSSQAELARALAEAMRAAAARATPAPLAGRRVLLADDSPHNRKAVAAYLRHAGAEVVEVDHGRAVLDHVRDGSWDAVLLDINMPGMDGLETAREIRALAPPPGDVPIIALTAHSDDATVRAAQAAGMNDFITKPVEAAVLYERLQALVPGHKPGAQLKPIFSAVAAGPADLLLNTERLESYRRIGMLGELMDDYLPEIAGLVGKLQRQVAQQDLQACLDTLHSLLGMSGEAGAQALYQAVRRVYVPMVESRSWPPQGGWAGQIAALAADTEKALKAYAASASIAQDHS
jgi:CheY-like chemotaxis protein/HPt (histidine-containing phosphotransfer) domain-containing protein